MPRDILEQLNNIVRTHTRHVIAGKLGYYFDGLLRSAALDGGGRPAALYRVVTRDGVLRVAKVYFGRDVSFATEEWVVSEALHASAHAGRNNVIRYETIFDI